MQVEVVRTRYNLRNGQKEFQTTVAIKDVDDNMEQQVLELFLSRLKQYGIFQTTSTPAYEGGGENDEKLES